MRATLDLPEDLCSEAMRLTHITTKTGGIIEALGELVRKARTAELKEYRGKIDLDINLNELRNRH